MAQQYFAAIQKYQHPSLGNCWRLQNLNTGELVDEQDTVLKMKIAQDVWDVGNLTLSSDGRLVKAASSKMERMLGNMMAPPQLRDSLKIADEDTTDKVRSFVNREMFKALGTLLDEMNGRYGRVQKRGDVEGNVALVSLPHIVNAIVSVRCETIVYGCDWKCGVKNPYFEVLVGIEQVNFEGKVSSVAVTPLKLSSSIVKVCDEKGKGWDEQAKLAKQRKVEQAPLTRGLGPIDVLQYSKGTDECVMAGMLIVAGNLKPEINQKDNTKYTVHREDSSLKPEAAKVVGKAIFDIIQTQMGEVFRTSGYEEEGKQFIKDCVATKFGLKPAKEGQPSGTDKKKRTMMDRILGR